MTRPVPALHWHQVQMAWGFGGTPGVRTLLSALHIVIVKTTLFWLSFIECASYVLVTVLSFTIFSMK